MVAPCMATTQDLTTLYNHNSAWSKLNLLPADQLQQLYNGSMLGDRNPCRASMSFTHFTLLSMTKAWSGETHADAGN